jgi:hypothetical protein
VRIAPSTAIWAEAEIKRVIRPVSLGVGESNHRPHVHRCEVRIAPSTANWAEADIEGYTVYVSVSVNLTTGHTSVDHKRCQSGVSESFLQ